MRVAVIGTGLGGLTCAKELLKYGLEVEIFEKCKQNESTRPRQMEGAVHFLDNIPKLPPTKEMKRAIFASKHEKVELEGKIGYIYEVGGPKGVETLLRKKVEKKVKINYGNEIDDANELKDSFQVIVAADGYRSKIAKNMNMRELKSKKRGFGIGFTVEGDFDPNQTWTLFDDYYAPKGYAYIIPFDKKYASFVSASVVNSINSTMIRKRLEKLAKKKDLEIINRWYDFETWFNFKTYHKNNVYVIGSAASLTEPTFGFGMKWAIKSARLCAESIATNQDYNELLKYYLLPEFKFWTLIRKIIDVSVKDEYSSFVKSFGNPLAKHFIEHGKYAPFLFKFAGWIKQIPEDPAEILRKSQSMRKSLPEWTRM